MRSPETLNPEAFIAANRAALAEKPTVVVAVERNPVDDDVPAPFNPERRAVVAADSSYVELCAVLEKAKVGPHGEPFDLDKAMSLATEIARLRINRKSGLKVAGDNAEAASVRSALIVILNQALRDGQKAVQAARLFIDHAEESM